MNRRKLPSEARLVGVRAAIRYLGPQRATKALQNPIPVIGRDILLAFLKK